MTNAIGVADVRFRVSVWPEGLFPCYKFEALLQHGLPLLTGGNRSTLSLCSRRSPDERSDIRVFAFPAYRCAHARYLLTKFAFHPLPEREVSVELFVIHLEEIPRWIADRSRLVATT